MTRFTPNLCLGKPEPPHHGGRNTPHGARAAGAPPFDRPELVDMSHTISATGKPFGLQRVCQALDFP
ncbi:MAG: hypothetical protein VB137_16160, partial [Burkholderia sp.]